jgi:hypothetical protein
MVILPSMSRWKTFLKLSVLSWATPIPPCKPTVLVNQLNCEEFLADEDNCGSNLFQNTIHWQHNRDAGCDANILGYRIYRGLSADGDFALLAEAGIVTDTFYVDTNVSSYAYCYKISAVDRSLNESELSDAVCNDNCPYYELPNVFTPNGDNCNDLFSATAIEVLSGEEGGCKISEDALTKCARFVKSVVFRVYNRWGQEVYSYEGSISDDIIQSTLIGMERIITATNCHPEFTST